ADSPPKPEPVDFRVVHADDDIVVLSKPAGLVVHPGAGHRVGTLAAGLLHRYPEIAGVGDPMRPGIVHRLDRDTSGLMVVARSAPSWSAAWRPAGPTRSASISPPSATRWSETAPTAATGARSAPAGRSSMPRPWP